MGQEELSMRETPGNVVYDLDIKSFASFGLIFTRFIILIFVAVYCIDPKIPKLLKALRRGIFLFS
ncbi:hypothetical protein B1F79_05175 [Coxiella-like endosymbiont of Rhipicephalus sanguineus]|uniref:hypothetical protein n=1 Tax=Coxiella-like endosymbiont of Rhipicephalus sanguineus TaxID=1955402 RepID=UPI00203B8AA5|nr:hypothetical protein [Coxiella-like endosymbiont of Rhipicephalus sanguineus]MBT8506793.1 hypothetical protein [Coxiella-like endosymbiont of Rhipicephalus sanguineus]